jgi:hypothetical protein
VGSISDYLEGQWINHVCGTSFTQPATVYVALCTADPTDAGTGASMSEVPNSGAYARQTCAFGAASARAIANSGTITFTQASGSWGTVTHWAIVDSATWGAGNMLAHGSLGTSKSIVNGNTPSFAAGQISISVSAGAWMTTFANLMLDKTFRNQTYNQPATYVGLMTTTAADGAAGTEVSTSGTAYARVLVNKVSGASPAWASISGGATSNANAVTFSAATATYGTVVATGIYDASSAGNLLMYDNGTADQAVASGDTVSFPIGDIDLSVS